MHPVQFIGRIFHTGLFIFAKQISQIQYLCHLTGIYIQFQHDIFHAVLRRISCKNQHISIFIKHIIMVQFVIAKIIYLCYLPKTVHLCHLLFGNTVIHRILVKDKPVTSVSQKRNFSS